MTPLTKKCNQCARIFTKNPRVGTSQWLRQNSCSQICGWKTMKGHIKKSTDQLRSQDINRCPEENAEWIPTFPIVEISSKALDRLLVQQHTLGANVKIGAVLGSGRDAKLSMALSYLHKQK